MWRHYLVPFGARRSEWGTISTAQSTVDIWWIDECGQGSGERWVELRARSLEVHPSGDLCESSNDGRSNYLQDNRETGWLDVITLKCRHHSSFGICLAKYAQDTEGLSTRLFVKFKLRYTRSKTTKNSK